MNSATHLSHLLRLNRRRNLLIFGGIFALFSCLYIGQVGAASTDPAARSGRLITFHDRGQSKVILTHAQTVRDALSDADISVVSADIVEPKLDEQLVATDYTVNIYRARPVIVVDGMVREKIMTAAQTADGITQAASIVLHDEDSTTLTQSQDVVADGAGEVLTINRAKSFKLSLYGTVTTAYSRADTVGQMLADKGIRLGSNDSLSVNAGAPLVAGMTVALWRNGVQTATVDEDVPFTTREIRDLDHPMGYKEVQTTGTKGRKSVTYQILMKDGHEVSRTAIQSVVLQAPKEEVVVVGAAPPPGSHQDWMAAAGIAESDFGFVSYIVGRENGSWNPCKVQGGAINCSYAGTAMVGYGLVQATPGNKMARAGSDWQTNPITQLRWASSYAVGRYGSWKAAYEYWLAHNNW